MAARLTILRRAYLPLTCGAIGVAIVAACSSDPPAPPPAPTGRKCEARLDPPRKTAAPLEKVTFTVGPLAPGDTLAWSNLDSQPGASEGERVVISPRVAGRYDLEVTITNASDPYENGSCYTSARLVVEGSLPDAANDAEPDVVVTPQLDAEADVAVATDAEIDAGAVDAQADVSSDADAGFDAMADAARDADADAD